QPFCNRANIEKRPDPVAVQPAVTDFFSCWDFEMRSRYLQFIALQSSPPEAADFESAGPSARDRYRACRGRGAAVSMADSVSVHAANAGSAVGDIVEVSAAAGPDPLWFYPSVVQENSRCLLTSSRSSQPEPRPC